MALEDNEITAPFISLIHREHAKYINENVNDCKNDSQFEKVLDRYNLYGKLKKIDGLG